MFVTILIPAQGSSIITFRSKSPSSESLVARVRLLVFFKSTDHGVDGKAAIHVLSERFPLSLTYFFCFYYYLSLRSWSRLPRCRCFNSTGNKGETVIDKM